MCEGVIFDGERVGKFLFFRSLSSYLRKPCIVDVFCKKDSNNRQGPKDFYHTFFSFRHHVVSMGYVSQIG